MIRLQNLNQLTNKRESLDKISILLKLRGEMGKNMKKKIRRMNLSGRRPTSKLMVRSKSMLEDKKKENLRTITI